MSGDTKRLDALPALRDVIRAHGLSARKELGQNFLLDLNLTRRIARAGGGLDGVTVIEVGPGPGGLTRALLAEGAARVIAIERDQRVLPALEDIRAACPGRLDIVTADALETELCRLGGDGPTRIIANLPYNIATPLLTGWLESQDWPPFFDGLVLMFQKEVAQRICARPGEKAYGRLGVLCGWRTHARLMFDVHPRAFTPAPKVVSAVVHLKPRADARAVSPVLMSRVTRAAFGQRRKMIRQSLKSLGVPLAPLLEAAGLTGTERAETLPVSAFLDMAAWLQEQGTAST